MADVFISYSRATREATLDLTEGLMNHGFSVWTDRNLMADQAPFRDVIDAAVDQAKAVVTIWSPPAIKSGFVQYEANRAFKQGKLMNARTHDLAPDKVPPEYFHLNSVAVSDVASIVNTLIAKAIQPEYGAAPLPPEEIVEREAIKEWRARVAHTEDPAVVRAFLDQYSRARRVADVAQRRLEALEAQAAALARDAQAQAAVRLFAAIQDETDADSFEFFFKKHAAAHPDLGRVAGQRLLELAPERMQALTLPAALSDLAEAAAAAIRRRNTKPEDAILRLDPGMHTAMITRLGVSADGRLMATGSLDKTVKLWALEGGKDGASARLVRTLRPPIGPGDEGKVYAVALDPVGRWVAAGGWMGEKDRKTFITLFDAETGRVRQRLGPLPNVVQHLAVSADGRWLAAGLGSGGVRVWALPSPTRGGSDRGAIRGGANVAPPSISRHDGYDAPPSKESQAGPTPDFKTAKSNPPLAGEGWRLAFEDKDYAADVYGLAFDGAGRLAASSYDGAIRLYDLATGQRLQRVTAPGGSRPHGLAFSPDGAALAVGYEDAPAVSLLDAATLAPRPGPDLAGLAGGNLGSVAFTTAGVLAAGGVGGGRADRLYAWPAGPQGPRAAWPGADNSIPHLAPLPGGGLAVAGFEPSFAVLDGAGKRLFRQGPPLADLRGKRFEHFTVSGDGRRVRFGLGQRSATPVLFDLARRTLENAPEPVPDLAQADTQSLPIAGWERTPTPTLAGAALALKPYERARSLAILPGKAGFILGASFTLRRFDAAGKQAWEQPVPGTCWGVNLAAGGRLILAAYGDGTIRWHRADTGAELLALFIHLPQGPAGPRHWVLYTPEGYYDCAPGAEDLIGWHVNRGEGEAADFYPASTFKSAFHKPARIDAALNEA